MHPQSARRGLAFLFCLWALPAAAAPEIWLCDLGKGQAGSPLFGTMVFSHDVAAKSVIISDGVSLSVKGEPVPGTVVSEDAKVTKFRWNLTGVPSSRRQKLELSYSATLRKPSGRLTLNVTPLGADNLFHGQGRCALQK